MRTRLFVVSSLAVASVLGAATAASATPQGPGDIKQCQQGCTPPTTAAPKGPDKFAPKPTTTTIPPKGPGDIAQPTDDGVVEPGPDTTDNGSGSDNYVPPASDDDTGNGAGAGVDVPAVQNAETAAPNTDQGSDGVNPFVIILAAAAAVVGALLALFATRLRVGANTRP